MPLFARFHPTTSDEQTRAFVQSRIALFLKMMLAAYVCFVAFVNLMYWLYPAVRPEQATLVNYLSLVGMGCAPPAIYLTSRERVLPNWFLLGLDAVTVVIISGLLTASGVLADDQEINVYASFMWMGYSVLGRCLIVPSTPKRTAVLTTVGLSPLVFAALVVEVEFPTGPLLAGALIFLVVLVSLATIGSQVIYGLRTQVNEAMQLGQYTILHKIGEGGMGTVYRARHAMLRRPTAIKLLKPERSSADHLTRFEREVQATSELAHPNTVAIYDYGRSPEGLFYYAMEYLDGIDLETLVARNGPQPWQRVVHIMRQVCGALEEAHAAGLIHRDIKPGNIILCTRGGIPDVAKVLDFGLVKDLDEAQGLTSGSAIAGTPAYVAPETITDPARVGASSDLYAVGALGYFLVTGELVFEGKTVVEMCMHHVDTPPPPPSARTENTIPPGFEQLLLECLAKDPTDRPDSAQSLKFALGQLQEADPWTEEQASAWWSEFEADRGAAQARPSPSSLATMTVDISSRADSEIESTDATI